MGNRYRSHLANGVFEMNQKQIEKKLKALGINLSAAAISRYAKHGLLPEPEKSHGGRGAGPQWIYPPEAAAHAGANFIVLQQSKMTFAQLKKVREKALEMEKGFRGISVGQKEIFAIMWIRAKKLIENGYNPGENNFIDKDGEVIAIVGDTSNWKADANLIAVAPEMYRVLEQLLRLNYDNDNSPAARHEWLEAWDEAEMVLRKVKGGAE